MINSIRSRSPSSTPLHGEHPTHKQKRRPGVQARTYGLLLSLLSCSPAFALYPEVPLSQLHHSQRTVPNGAPANARQIVQTRDGYIWILANGDLFRFDGVEFEHIERVGATPLPSKKIANIWAPPGDGLWVSYVFGGATFIGDGTVRTYSLNEDLPAHSWTSMAQDGNGQMWVATTRGLLRLQGEQWVPMDENWQIPQIAIIDLAVDRDATLWVLSTKGLFYLRAGSLRFEKGLELTSTVWSGDLVTSPDGLAWLAHAGTGLTQLQLPEPGTPVRPQWRTHGFDSEAALPYILIDRHSNLWISAWGVVKRMPLTGAARATPDGIDQLSLAGELTGAMLEDREGNVWAVSSGGVDKFRSSAFVKMPLANTSYGTAALAATKDGSVWIGTFTGDLHRFEGDVKRESMSSPASQIDALHGDATGKVWLGGSNGSIYHRQGDRWIEWRPDDAENAGGISAIVSQPDGTLWVSVVRVGVYRVVDNRWTLWGGLADLPHDTATTLAVDSKGRLWLGYPDNRLAVVDHDQVNIYDAADGLSVGPVLVTSVRGSNIWIGGEKGLNWFDGRRFHSVAGERGHAFALVNGIVEQAVGDLWLNTTEGAVLIPATGVRDISAGRPPKFRLFNYLDGVPGAGADVRPLPSAVETSDGRIWFATSNGVVSHAPRWPSPNPIVPSVYIKSMTVDGTRVDARAPGTATLQLSTKPHVLQIAYTATSYAIPERVHFRYRLEGSEIGWQDAGRRREAQFTGLPPGTYRFQVIASNDSDVWNETGASVDFEIPPTFLQSRKFIVVCVASGAAVLWLLFASRMRQVKARLQSRNEERLLERERIARELHDTFLQGIHGLMLRFQSATERIPEGHPARRLMEESLDRGDRILAEGRDKVSELRAHSSLKLTEALTMVGNELSRDYAVSYQTKTDGAARELNPAVQEEVYRIGTEALINAFRHASATHIATTVVFGRRRFEMRVVDDGCGFDPSHDKPGRWGLQGMRERAEKIHGKLLVSSQPGVGTTLELHIPSKLAYRKAASPRWNRRKHYGAATMEDPT
ncbi:sensor histidine kinase [Povalibacter sp.]|uniref:sensor histidine kinase n=1 Tax=Povalibacter sp. TaxID=1962978 RepID=UPI002F410A94